MRSFRALVLGGSVLGAWALVSACQKDATDASRTRFEPTAPSGDGRGHVPGAGQGDETGFDDAGIGDAGDSLDPRIAKLVAYAEKQIARAVVPGAGIAVVRNGKLFWAGGVGVKKTGGSDRVTADTLFRAASMSKMVAAATVESLVQDGTLDLKAPITRYTNAVYLQDGFDLASLTLEELLSHTAGLPDGGPLLCRESTRAEWFSHYELPLWSPPGRLWNYSNTNFAVAGFVAETRAGIPYEDLVAERVFGPAGMRTATFDAAAAMRGDFATGRSTDAQGKAKDVVPTDISCAFTMPAGGVLASVTDYAHFIEAMLAHGGNVISHERADDMMSPRIATRDLPSRTYALGLMRQEWSKGITLVTHGGDVPGYHSELGFLPDENLGIVIMVNGDSSITSAPDNIMTYGLGLFASTPEQVPSLRTDARSWRDYPGSYDDKYGSLGGVFVALSDAGVLTADFAMWDAGGPLRQLATDGWLLPAPISLPATFWREREDAGGATFLVTRAGVGVRAAGL